MRTRQLTIFEHSILELIRSSKKGYEPIGLRAKEAAQILTRAGLVQEIGVGIFQPVTGATFNYRGNKHTIKI